MFVCYSNYLLLNALKLLIQIFSHSIQGSLLTVGQVTGMILEFLISTKASHKQVDFVLKLMHNTLPTPNNMPSTWHQFQQLVRTHTVPV